MRLRFAPDAIEAWPLDRLQIYTRNALAEGDAVELVQQRLVKAFAETGVWGAFHLRPCVDDVLDD